MKEVQESKEKLLVISEAAEYLGVSIDTVRRWDNRGILHAIRSGDKTRYFSLTELDAVKNGLPRAKTAENILRIRSHASLLSNFRRTIIIVVQIGFFLFTLLTLSFLLFPNETSKILTVVFNALR